MSWERLGFLSLPAALAMSLVLAVSAAQADNACRTALETRIKRCADDCVARAKAAVDPDVRGRILGYGCSTNCAKLEMFNGHACPAE